MNDIHEEIHSVLAAYVMSAVPEEEVPAIRAHILSCEQCFEEAERFAAALAIIPESIEAEPLPRGFADRVVTAAVGEEAKPEKAKRKTRWAPSLRWSLAGLAGAAVVIALVVSTVALVSSNNRVDEYRAAVAAVVHDPDARTLGGAGGAEGVIAATDEGAVLVVADLGEAPTNRDYQLWLIEDGVPVPAETFDASGSVVVVNSQHSFDESDGAAVTVEPEGGSAEPTTDPVLSTS
jgi:anti-sigma-K factor RskA